jgi:hypothetical protein
MSRHQDDFDTLLQRVTSHVLHRYDTLETLDTIPTQEKISSAVRALPAHLPEQGLGTHSATSFLFEQILPGCLPGQPGPRYFGFVTGGVTPAAQLADILTGSYDENVQMTLPNATVSTAVEARSLEMVLDLLEVPRENYPGRTITTGATASNVLGMGTYGLPVQYDSRADPQLVLETISTRDRPTSRRDTPTRKTDLPAAPIFPLHPSLSLPFTPISR